MQSHRYLLICYAYLVYMNFLAHLYLSGNNAKVMVGNFIGDFVRGRNLAQHFEPDIIKGIEMHRAIDHFTDHHAVVLKSKVRLRAKYRHYAPVIVDVFYDHFLAKNWSHYHNSLLADYAQRAYQTIESFNPILPDEVKTLLPYMIRGNWLVNYSRIEGIQRALTGMARRTKFDSKMNESVDELQLHYEAFQNEFGEFFPQLQVFCKTFI